MPFGWSFTVVTCRALSEAVFLADRSRLLYRDPALSSFRLQERWLPRGRMCTGECAQGFKKCLGKWTLRISHTLFGQNTSSTHLTSEFAVMLVTTTSETETRNLGRQLARCLEPGLTIALNAQLGSGKTHLTKAVCGGLGIEESRVNSPTFVLMQIYSDGQMPVAHFDTYRLADVDEFLAIGGEEYLFDSETICFVEWAERIQDVLPADHLRVTISQTGATERTFQFEGTGPKSDGVVEKLAALRS